MSRAPREIYKNKTCQICGMIVKKRIKMHIIKHHTINIKQYVLDYFYNTNQPLCKCGCGSLTNFNIKYMCFADYIERHNVSYQYREMPDDIKNRKENTLRKNYGVSNIFQLSKTKDAIKNTIIERYGVNYSSQIQSKKEKSRKTNLKRYGLDCLLKDKDKMREAMRNKYGVEYPQQNKEIALKTARSMNNSGVTKHWKTGEQLVWVAGYEKAFLEWANKNQIEFDWQIVFQTPFLTPSGKSFSTYMIDAYLVKEDKWVEIKGYPRLDACSKWLWFHEKYPNSELWDKKRLKELKII